MTTLNCDMGESYGIWQLGDDARLMPLIDLANVACGFHASDFDHMRRTVQLAKRHKVAVGAHPSLPDRQGFGRRAMAMGREELANCLIYQIGALKGFLDAEALPLHHVKPHGALYGMALREEAVAHAICDAAGVFGVPVLGLAGSRQEQVYAARGQAMLAEFYADLDYADDGALVITREHPPLDPAATAARVLRAIRHGTVESLGGQAVPVRADTICVHSDTPNAPEITAAIREALAAIDR